MARITLFSTLLLCLSQVRAVTMTKYSASSDVQAEFETFLEGLYTQAEDPASTTAFTDYFTSDGTLIVLENVATGASEILALKHTLLPAAGTKHWNHYPNVTTIYSDTTTETIYKVNGAIQTTFDGGNCSQAYYQSRFTVLKSGGVPDFTAQSGSLVSYDDYVVSPATSPTDIECDE